MDHFNEGLIMTKNNSLLVQSEISNRCLFIQTRILLPGLFKLLIGKQ
jgi:hypothetical protein